MYGHVLELADVRPKCREFRKRRIRKSRSTGCARQKYSDYRVRENTIEYYKKKKRKKKRKTSAIWANRKQVSNKNS